MTKNKDLIANLCKEHAEIKPYCSRNSYFEWLAMIAIYVTVVLAICGIRDDISERMMDRNFVIELGICAIIALWAGYAQIITNVPSKYCFIRNLIIPAFLVLVLAVLIVIFGKVSRETLSESMGQMHFETTGVLVALTIFPALYSFFRLCRGAPTKLGLSGAMTLLSSATVAYIILRLYFQSDDLSSIMLWCYIPILLLSMCGILIGRKFLKW